MPFIYLFSLVINIEPIYCFSPSVTPITEYNPLLVDVDNLKNAVDRLENDLNDCCIRKDQLHDDPVNSINKSDNHGVVPHEEPSNTDDSSEETVENENEVDEEIEDSKPTKQKNLFDFEEEE